MFTVQNINWGISPPTLSNYCVDEDRGEGYCDAVLNLQRCWVLLPSRGQKQLQHLLHSTEDNRRGHFILTITIFIAEPTYLILTFNMLWKTKCTKTFRLMKRLRFYYCFVHCIHIFNLFLFSNKNIHQFDKIVLTQGLLSFFFRALNHILWSSSSVCSAVKLLFLRTRINFCTQYTLQTERFSPCNFTSDTMTDKPPSHPLGVFLSPLDMLHLVPSIFFFSTPVIYNLHAQINNNNKLYT